jgi:predicted Holliday junction resolvase-like endonuclease
MGVHILHYEISKALQTLYNWKIKKISSFITRGNYKKKKRKEGAVPPAASSSSSEGLSEVEGMRYLGIFRIKAMNVILGNVGEQLCPYLHQFIDNPLRDRQEVYRHSFRSKLPSP